MTDEVEHKEDARAATSLWLTLLFLALWAGAVILIYFGGPIWAQLLLGVLGFGVAIADRQYISKRARAKVYNQQADSK